MKKTHLLALALSLLESAMPDANGAGFVSTSSMHYARASHTATVLPNGKVLVAGGFGAAGTSAELYDPATGMWTVTNGMHASRAGATATLLPNGKVLVAGGGQSGGSYIPSTSAELYDPTTGTWKVTGSMKKGQVLHTATLLPNGKVLVVGQPDTELFDPAAGTWTDAGSVGSGIASFVHTATLLPDGKALLVGWYQDTELYDPTAGTWTTTSAPSSLPPNRGYDTATLLLNGKVLAASGGHVSAAELYDFRSGTWSATGSLTWDRDYCEATLLRNGQVLITGGYQQETDTPVASGELYDPTTGTWTVIPMNGPHFNHTATLLPNGKVLVAGGLNSSFSSLSSAELFEPDSDGAAPSMTILHQTNQILSFSWTGVGTLEQADSLTTLNWQPAPIQDNPHIINTTDPMQFFQIKVE